MTGRADDPVLATVSPAERAAMAHAVELARRGPSYGPNPQVGCVLLAADGRRVAEGWHAGAGTLHAEADALARARADGIDLTGSTAVVTLEPCAHTGRTGPCADALVAAGVARVVFAVADPNPAAAGGADRLRAAQVDVVGGVLQDEGRALLRVWLTAMTQGRPFVTAKLAASLDGRAAASDGSSRWITSEQARAHAHRVRAAVDAVAVGTGTVVVDDPALTARGADGTLDPHQPMRVVVGHRAVPAAARMLQAGADVVRLATHDVHEVLAHLAGLEVRHLLVEGGPTLVAAFLRAGVVDEVHAYIAPVLLGGGLPAVGDLGITTIGSALRLRTRSVERLGPDVLLIAEPAPADGPPGEEP